MDRVADSLMLRLSFSAYASLRGHDRRASKAAVSRALAFFGVPGSIEWFAVSDDHHRFNFALAFVVVTPTDSGTDYAVVVRGTNPLSLDSWIREDFDVGSLVRWSGNPAEGKVSQATATALALHLGLRDKKAPLFTFLADRIADDEAAGRTSTVRFTGHSLGGLLAPVLALRFSETFPRFGSASFHVVSFAAPTPGDSVFAGHLERSFLESPRQNFGTVRFVRCRDDVAVLVWNKRDLLGIVRLYAAYGVPINLFVLTVVAALRWRVRKLDYTQPFASTPEGGRFRIPSSDVFSLDAFDAEAFLAGRLAVQFHRARVVAKRRTSPRIFQKTLAWLVQAVVMHVVPYALHLLEPHEQAYVRDTLLQTILTQDVLFTDRRLADDPGSSLIRRRGDVVTPP
jgi:pimeloyl-ACP methyl ester carboxylesterase